MEFSFSQNRKGTTYLGLMMKPSRRFVFDVDRCYLASEWFSKVLNNVRTFAIDNNLTSFNQMECKGFLRNLTIKEGKNTKCKFVCQRTKLINFYTLHWIRS